MMKVAAVLVLVMVMMAAMAVVKQTEAQKMKALRTVIAASKAFPFSFAYEKETVKPSKVGNMMASPLSAGAVLALLLQGAGGRTAQELRTALHLPDDAAAVRLGYQALFDALQNKGDMELRIANMVYTRKGLKVQKSFKNTAVNFFRARVQELDYANDPKGTRKIINSWVEDFTSGYMTDIRDYVNNKTLMVLVNVIYFKGTCMLSSPENDTKMEPFPTKLTSKVPTMHLMCCNNHSLLSDLSAQLMELPQGMSSIFGWSSKQQGSVKIMVILPNNTNGLKRVEENLQKVKYDKNKKQMNIDEIFRTDRGNTTHGFNVYKTLNKLGIRELFTNANLKGLIDAKVRVNVNIYHQVTLGHRKTTGPVPISGAIATPVFLQIPTYISQVG